MTLRRYLVAAPDGPVVAIIAAPPERIWDVLVAARARHGDVGICPECHATQRLLPVGLAEMEEETLDG